MRTLSLRSRLLLWASAASALPLALVVILADGTFRANIREQLGVGLTFARQVAEGARSSQIDAQIGMTVTAAVDTRLRAAVSTGDSATVAQTLTEVFPRGAETWAAVLDAEGRLIAGTGPVPFERLGTAGRLVAEALYYDTADLWPVDDRLVEVTASAILFGANPLAVLVTGHALGVEELTALETAAGRPVAAIMADGAVRGVEAAHISAEGLRVLTSWQADAGAEVGLLDLGGERFFAAATPLLSNDGSRVGTLVLLDSLDAALRPSNALRLALLSIFGTGLLLTFGVSGMLSRAVTVPVGQLLRATERLGGGDLEHPIEPLRDDELGRLARSFDGMRTSLKTARAELIRAERLSAIGKAASAVAHDFTQPLSTIAGAVGLLRVSKDVPETRERCLTAIEDELDRLGRMKQEIVEFARGESKLDAEEIRVDSFLENAISALKVQLAESDVTLTVDHGYAGTWYLDSYRMERAVENLVRNAAAAIGRSGAVEIRSHLDSEALVLEIEDDGPGIPTEKLDEIFEPFVTYGKKEGTGLGLAITRNVVTQHGGTIGVVSNPGSTRFTMQLPRHPELPSSQANDART